MAPVIGTQDYFIARVCTRHVHHQSFQQRGQSFKRAASLGSHHRKVTFAATKTPPPPSSQILIKLLLAAALSAPYPIAYSPPHPIDSNISSRPHCDVGRNKSVYSSNWSNYFCKSIYSVFFFFFLQENKKRFKGVKKVGKSEKRGSQIKKRVRRCKKVNESAECTKENGWWSRERERGKIVQEKGIKERDQKVSCANEQSPDCEKKASRF